MNLPDLLETMCDKPALRKLDFPQCAKEALIRVEQLCVPQAGSRPTNSKDMDQASDIMAEFIFCEVDRRGGKRRLSSIQQLQLAQMLCDHFAGVTGIQGGLGSDTARNTLFLSLFPPNTGRERAQALLQLVSMAISMKNQPLLAATGVWMQQLGCTSKLVLQLADSLVKDYFVLVPRAVTRLQDLPQLAPHFTANFLSTVAEMYASIEQKDKSCPAPPPALLEVVTQWVTDNPGLCLAALLVNLQPLLPPGCIPMAALTPFAGLLKWCILAPLYSCVHPSSSASSSASLNGVSNDMSNGLTNGVNKLESETRVKEVCQKKMESTKPHQEKTRELKAEPQPQPEPEPAEPEPASRVRESPLYSQLHLALIKSLADCSYTTCTQDVVSAQHLAAMVEPVWLWRQQQQQIYSQLQPHQQAQRHQAIQLSLDRLGQAVQVALATHCIYGNKQDLLAQLKTLSGLKEGRLLRIVLLKQDAL